LLSEMATTLATRPPTDEDRRELVIMLRWLAKVVREMDSEPQMSLIVWDGSAYRVSEGLLPGRRFGVDMTDYAK